MNRRDFFKASFAATAALGTAAVLGGVELDLDKLLWVPGEKRFFLPPEKTLLTDVAAIEQEYASLAKTDLAFTRGVFHEVYTAVGRVESDARWNVISVGGRKVSAHEAAFYRLTNFQPYQAHRVTADAQTTMTNQIIGERFAAGWPYPEAVAGLPKRSFYEGDFVASGAPNYGWPAFKAPAISSDGVLSRRKGLGWPKQYL